MNKSLVERINVFTQISFDWSVTDHVAPTEPIRNFLIFLLFSSTLPVDRIFNNVQLTLSCHRGCLYSSQYRSQVFQVKRPNTEYIST